MLYNIDYRIVLEDSVCKDCKYVVARSLDPDKVDKSEYNIDTSSLKQDEEAILIHVACTLLCCDLNDDVVDCSGFSESSDVLFKTPDYAGGPN